MTITTTIAYGPLTVLCGNPRPGSRTLEVALRTADALAAEQAAAGDAATPGGATTAGAQPGPRVIDLAHLAPHLFRGPDADIDEALRLVASSSVLIVASPVCKASYTGLLKAFLDRYGPSPLVGVVAVPLMLVAQPGHRLAADTHLRPLLVELGASTPTTSLVVEGSELGPDPGPVEEWAAAQAGLAWAAARTRDPVGV